MGRFTGKKNRVARRFGANVFGRRKNPLTRKPNPPGAHGARRRKKSDFGLQLEEKQKLKAVYGMLREKQLVNYFKKAEQAKGNTTQQLAQFLECRLDTVVYRLGFAATIFAAQQLVSHGHICVNGKKVDIRSFHVNLGMKITVREKSRKMHSINHSLDVLAHNVPEYLTLDRENYKGEFNELPFPEQMPWPLEINLATICDFLAHTT